MGTPVVVGDMEKYWKEEEDEALDSTAALKCRPPRTPSQLPSGLSNSSSSSSEVLDVQNDGEEEQPQAEESQTPPPMQDEEKSQQAATSVYLDTQDGKWKCHHCTWTYQTGSLRNGDPIQNSHANHCHQSMHLNSLVHHGTYFRFETKGTKSTNGFGGMKYSVAGHSVEEKKLENGESDLTLKGVDVPNSLTTESDCGSKQDAGQPSLTYVYSEKSLENASAGPGIDIDTDLRVLNEGKQYISEWDVETVIAEQETHDLFCPNCKSCITKRVIVRKRKRQTNLQNGSKRKVYQGHDTAPPVIDVSPPVVTSDQDRVTEPDLFRCLSCFSYFIPSVACFKSFFGYRGESESGQTGAVNQERENAMVQPEEVVSGESNSQYPPKLQSNEISPVLTVVSKSPIESANDPGLVQQEKKELVVSSTSVRLDIEKNGVAPHSADMKNREEKNNATASAVSPATFPQPLYSHVDEHFNISTTQTWNYDQHGQVSSNSVSVHRENTRSNTDDNQMNSTKRNDGGFDAMKDLSTGELSKPLEHLDKNLPVENNGSLNTPGFQLPRISDGNLEEHMSLFEPLLPQDKHTVIGKDLEGPPRSIDAGKDVRVQIEEERFRSNVSENSQNIINSSTTDTSTYRVTEYRGEQQVDDDTSSSKWDILKSIVYGGLVESITSLGVVSSAAGGGAATLNIIAIGLASLVGGLFMIAHGLVDLKNEEYGRDTTQFRSVDRYQELLGNRRSFKLHAALAILSYLLFGLVAPVTYCFSFQESDNRDYKLISVAVASLVCIAVLAFSKVYAQQPPKAYFKTVMYYVSIGVMSSGLSYVVGVLVKKLLEDLGWFEPTVAPPRPTGFLEQVAAGYLSSY